MPGPCEPCGKEYYDDILENQERAEDNLKQKLSRLARRAEEIQTEDLLKSGRLETETHSFVRILKPTTKVLIANGEIEATIVDVRISTSSGDDLIIDYNLGWWRGGHYCTMYLDTWEFKLVTEKSAPPGFENGIDE